LLLNWSSISTTKTPRWCRSGAGLERIYRKPLSELNLREQNRQAKDQISIGNAFTSLRQLALLDWRRIFEQLSRVEGLLRLDPSGVYPKMDFDSRDRYRRAMKSSRVGPVRRKTRS